MTVNKPIDNTDPKNGLSTQFQWRPNWKIIVFVLILLPVLCIAGNWQLNRAVQKQTLQQNWTAQQLLPPLESLDGIDTANHQYRRFQALGHFDPKRYWLLDNSIFQGRVGYQVISPFTLKANQLTLLVNRGWVEGTGYRDQLPTVDVAAGEHLVVGNLVAPSDHPMLSMLAQDSSSPWPRVILEANIEAMQTEVGVPLAKKILQIEASVDSAFQVDWRPFNMSASKHHGYAVQWFGMAIALLILGFIANSNIVDCVRSRTKTAKTQEN